MQMIHDSVIIPGRYLWGEAYVLSFISEIYKYKDFHFKSNKDYYIDEEEPSIHVENLDLPNRRKIGDSSIVLVNITKFELRKITKIIFKYIE